MLGRVSALVVRSGAENPSASAAIAATPVIATSPNERSCCGPSATSTASAATAPRIPPREYVRPSTTKNR